MWWFQHFFIITHTITVRGYSTGSAVDVDEPGEKTRELQGKKQNLQMELRQRMASVPNMYHGTKLAVSLTSSDGATRLTLASGDGLLVIIDLPIIKGTISPHLHPLKICSKISST